MGKFINSSSSNSQGNTRNFVDLLFLNGNSSETLSVDVYNSVDSPSCFAIFPVAVFASFVNSRSCLRTGK